MDGWAILNIFALLGMVVIVAPTIVYIFCIPKFIRLASQQGSIIVTTALIAAYILVPYFFWAAARSSADAALQKAQDIVDAIPVAQIGMDIPKFIAARGGTVLRPINLGNLSCPKSKPKEGNGITYLLTPTQLAVIQMKQRERETTEAKKPYPKRYLILESDRMPPYPTDERPAAGGQTKRLYLYDNGKETLIGVHFIPYVAKPYDVPILTLQGWFKQSSAINATNDHVNNFLRSALNVKCIDLKIIGPPKA